MKFWQKAFICVLLCFLVGFDVTAVLIVRRNQEMSRNSEITASQNEHYAISNSIEDRLRSVSGNHTELNSENIEQYIQPYTDIYRSQDVFFVLLKQDTTLFSNFTGGIPDISELNSEDTQPEARFYNVDGIDYLIIASKMYLGENALTFVYVKDESALMSYLRDISGYTVKVGAVVSIILSIMLILLLLGLTRPIATLNRAASDIAGGNYQKRVRIKSRDEIGDFSRMFNTMAGSIESHVKQLSLVAEEKQRFIDNLSHEMRTPVAAVIGYGDLLKNDGITRDERLLATDYIIGQSLRLQSLSTKLLQLASMTEGAIKLVPVKIGTVIDNARDTLKTQINEKELTVETVIDKDAGIVTGDADLLESLLQNLMENAIRALNSGGKIKVTAAVDAVRVCVTVADDGPGMAEAELEKIFEPFYRVDKSRFRGKAANGGAGLGLSICKRICDIHNAELKVFSHPGKGTSVKIYFTTP